MESITLKSVPKVSLLKNEAYLVLVDLAGHRYFAIVAYKGCGKFAQDDCPDLDIENVVTVFEKPSEACIFRTQ